MEHLERALSWLTVFAVGLAPMLIYWVAGLIKRAVHNKTRDLATLGGEGEKKEPGRPSRRTASSKRCRSSAE